MRNLERYSRNIRNENRATITTHKNAPRKNEGVDGDIRITTTTTEGVKLFTKYNGEWYSTPLSKHIIKEKNQDRRDLASMSSLGTNGYQKLDSGLIIQWGVDSRNTDSAYTLTFTEEFPIECFGVMVNRQTADAESPILAISYTTTGFTVDRDDSISGSQTINYMAIGY